MCKPNLKPFILTLPQKMYILCHQRVLQTVHCLVSFLFRYGPNPLIAACRCFRKKPFEAKLCTENFDTISRPSWDSSPRLSVCYVIFL